MNVCRNFFVGGRNVLACGKSSSQFDIQNCVISVYYLVIVIFHILWLFQLLTCRCFIYYVGVLFIILLFFYYMLFCIFFTYYIVIVLSIIFSNFIMYYLVPVFICYRDSSGTGALIITPVRELGEQTFGVLKELLQFHPLTCGLIHGGTDRKAEAKKLTKGVNIVVATPGRLLDHLQVVYFVYNFLFFNLLLYNCDYGWLFITSVIFFNQLLQYYDHLQVSYYIRNLLYCYLLLYNYDYAFLWA